MKKHLFFVLPVSFFHQDATEFLHQNQLHDHPAVDYIRLLNNLFQKHHGCLRLLQQKKPKSLRLAVFQICLAL